MRNDSEKGVPCQCGEMPILLFNSNGNEMEYLLQCMKCGDKGAKFRRSQFIAINEWENHYHKIKP